MARGELDPSARAAIAGVLAEPKFELIPLKNADEQAAHLPPGATVTVTASPAKGMEATIELCERLQALGFRVIPHLSARMIRDRAHLAELLDRIAAAAIDRAFVVGGDAEQPGEYLDGLSLLRAMAEVGHGLTDIGVPGYPEGHTTIPEPALHQALADKQPFVQYMTTQMCFDPGAIAAWLTGRRVAGIKLPVWIGLPGVAELHRLMIISARIGVADTKRFLAKNTRLVGRLVRPGGYSPHGLLEGLAPALVDPTADIRGLHIYTFNQVETTEEWRQRYVERLNAVRASA
ncbi:MAG: methylenetetrahydrofolate reductase [Candidatus Limnocylindrales bacterium]